MLRCMVVGSLSPRSCWASRLCSMRGSEGRKSRRHGVCDLSGEAEERRMGVSTFVLYFRERSEVNNE